MSQPAPLVILLAVGLTRRWLPYAPRLAAMAAGGWVRSFSEVTPAVTCSAQATLLTGELPQRHGIVANGWLFRDTGEVRFWQQSNRLLEAEPFYATARRRAAERGWRFRAAKLFWWFNQGAEVELAITPKPYYGADGNKAFAIDGQPRGLTNHLEARLGPFPFPTFWGPMAGLPCTRWIARCAAEILRGVDEGAPDLTLVYLPHLDYDPQRLGSSGSDMPRLVRELDAACEPLLDAARGVGARVWVVSEYGHCDVRRPVLLNRVLREAGWLHVRPGPFGEILDTFASEAFAVCDHQFAHIYVRDPSRIEAVRERVAAEPGVDRVLTGVGREEWGLDHPRSGELVALSDPVSWFAYPFWDDDDRAPDYARTVDIHRKPGYDPCELLFDPAIPWPKARVVRRLIGKKLGFRTLMDVIPLDPTLVRGSHGRPASAPEDQPVWIGEGEPPGPSECYPMTSLRPHVLRALGLEDGSSSLS